MVGQVFAKGFYIKDRPEGTVDFGAEDPSEVSIKLTQTEQTPSIYKCLM